jgi:transposase
MFGISLSTGSISSMISRCALKVGDTLEKIRRHLSDDNIVHFDETGARTAGTLYWVHNSSTGKYTYQTVSRKRGREGMEDNGVLPEFSGTAVHDCWASYWRYDDIDHAICGAHVLRELTGIEENWPEHIWSVKFKELLLSMKASKEKAQAKGKDHLSRYCLKKYSKEYDEIVDLAEQECPVPVYDDFHKRGRKKKGKERSLIERLQVLKDEVCLFIHDFDVPFDNNQAERDLRNVKTKIKVSGCFRSEKGAQDYLDVMSYLSTGRKHGISVFDALTAAFNGNSDIVLL